MSVFWEQQRERGTVVALRLLFACSVVLRRPAMRWLLWPIAGYFLLTSPTAVRASRQALSRLLGHEPTRRDVLINFHCFAQCAVDRFYFLRGQQTQFEVTSTRPPEVVAVANSGAGCLMLLAHLGSFEAMRMTGAEGRD